MIRFLFPVLYIALCLSANRASAEFAELENLREGSMKKLVFSEPAEVSEESFTDADGGTYQLSGFAGKYTLVNFWATWCAPCRKEMPMLSELQAEFGGEDFEVVAIATGRNTLAGIYKFFEEISVDNLTVYLDPKQALARDMAVLGLPITLILDPSGKEIARMRGDAEWNSESAKAIIRALLEDASAS